MNVLVTGATGFIGTNLIRHLGADPSLRVLALVRPKSDARDLKEVNVTIITGDLTQPGSLQGLREVPDIQEVYHLAGKLGQWGVREDDYRQLHVGGTENLIGALDTRRLNRLIMFSSPSVAGPSKGTPWTEDEPFHPTNAYERTKAEAEEVLRRLATVKGFSMSIIRPEFVYGPYDRHVLGLIRAIDAGRFRVIGSGDNLFQPTYIVDVIRGFDLIRKSPPAAGEVFHVAGGETLTLNQLSAAIAGALGVPVPKGKIPRPVADIAAAGFEAGARLLGFDPPLTRQRVRFFTEDHVFSIDKAEKILGYRPAFPFQDGIRRTVEWYRQRGDLGTYAPVI